MKCKDIRGSEIPEEIYEMMHFESDEDYKLSCHKHKVNRDNGETFEECICNSMKTGKNCYSIRSDKALVDCIGRFICLEDQCEKDEKRLAICDRCAKADLVNDLIKKMS